MCLLVKQLAGCSFTREHIEDFYHSNRDGFGYAYAENNVLYTMKLVGTVDDVWDAYQKVAGRECVFHLRMATHGDIDLLNCHPYEVLGESSGYPLYMFHNGILSTSNDKDKTKSDTWHFIHDFIQPMLGDRPERFMEPWFKELIQDYIGSTNKFVLLDAYGNVVTCNENSGVMFSPDGVMPEAWMSNTYAWSANKYLKKETRTTGYGWNRRYGTYMGFDDEDYVYGSSLSGNNIKALPEPSKAEDDKDLYVEEWEVHNFASTFLDLLVELGYEDLYDDLNYNDLTAFYESVGETYAWALLADMEEVGMTDQEIRYELNGWAKKIDVSDAEAVESWKDESERLAVGMM